jgi:hypothetical protein
MVLLVSIYRRLLVVVISCEIIIQIVRLGFCNGLLINKLDVAQLEEQCFEVRSFLSLQIFKINVML